MIDRMPHPRTTKDGCDRLCITIVDGRPETVPCEYSWTLKEWIIHLPSGMVPLSKLGDPLCALRETRSYE